MRDGQKVMWLEGDQAGKEEAEPHQDKGWGPCGKLSLDPRYHGEERVGFTEKGPGSEAGRGRQGPLRGCYRVQAGGGGGLHRYAGRGQTQRYFGGRVGVSAVLDAGAEVGRNQSTRRMVGPLWEGDPLPGPGLGEARGPESGLGSLLNLYASGTLAGQAGARGLKETLVAEATQPRGG